jgi:O-acetyl-ADP-ribose deacetylase
MPQKQLYATMIILNLGDITKSTADAIINDASSNLKESRGPSKAIYAAAGAPLLAECKRILDHDGPIQVGQACVTDGGLLKAKYIIHAVGPIWQGGGAQEEEKLGETYLNALKVAADYSLKIVALTPLGIGEHARYPVEKSAHVAIHALEEFCRSDERLKEVHIIISDSFVFSVFQKAFTY